MEQQDVAAVNLSITLSTLAGPAPATASESEFETIKNWARNWLSKAHPDLGRKGPVCPFTGTSIARDMFRVAFVRGHELAHDQMVSLLEEIARTFQTLHPDGTDSIYRTVVIVFPEVTAYDQ